MIPSFRGLVTIVTFVVAGCGFAFAAYLFGVGEEDIGRWLDFLFSIFPSSETVPG